MRPKIRRFTEATGRFGAHQTEASDHTPDFHTVQGQHHPQVPPLAVVGLPHLTNAHANGALRGGTLRSRVIRAIPTRKYVSPGAKRET